MDYFFLKENRLRGIKQTLRYTVGHNRQVIWLKTRDLNSGSEFYYSQMCDFGQVLPVQSLFPICKIKWLHYIGVSQMANGHTINWMSHDQDFFFNLNVTSPLKKLWEYITSCKSVVWWSE